MIPYLLLAAYVLFCWLLHYRGILGRGPFLVACLVPAWALLAFRGSSVGEDTAMYLHMADVADGLPWNDVLVPWGSIVWNMDEWGYGSTVDLGYLALCKIVMGITGDSQWVIAVCSAIICFGFGRFFYHCEEDVAQSTWCFLCGGLYMFSFNGMRQMVALAVAVQCFHSMRCGHWYRAAALVAIASLIHVSALVLLAAVFAARLLELRRTYAVLIGCSIALPLLVSAAGPLVAAISPQYASYFQNNYWDAQVGGVALWWLAIAVCCFVVIRVGGGSSGSLPRFSSVCGTVYLALELSAMRVSILERVALYFLPFVCLLVPQAKSLISEKNRWWFSLGINLILLALYFSYASSSTRYYVLYT